MRQFFSPAMNYNRSFSPVDLLPDDLHKLQDALDGIHRGHAVVRPGRVVKMQHVLCLICL